MILEQIVLAKRQRLAEAKLKLPLEALKAQAVEAAGVLVAQKYPFKRALALEGIQFICEVKKASPSKGVISASYPFVEIALNYAKAGAAAVSCLTEEDHFLGKATDLKRLAGVLEIPLLRKDFIFDPYQVYETVAIGASAILLIVSILEKEQLRELHALATRLGLSALVEVHDAAELATALGIGADIIGVNNRNLHDFSVDFQNSLALQKLMPAGRIFVAESGVRTRTDIACLEAQGIDAVLVGEALMQSHDVASKLAELRGAVR